jgi:hypothetical protein
VFLHDLNDLFRRTCGWPREPIHNSIHKTWALHAAENSLYREGATLGLLQRFTNKAKHWAVSAWTEAH